MQPTQSPWPSLRRRTRSLLTEAYAEAVGDVVGAVQRALPPAGVTPNAQPSLGAVFANWLLSGIAVFVACFGACERVVLGSDGLPVHEIREASLQELHRGAGALNDKKLLPSAYEIWIGPRSDGILRLRYAYNATLLASKLEGAHVRDYAPQRVCVPLELDGETIAWVGARVRTPAAASRLQVWRVLKKRLYHYDAGVVAFWRFPRNWLLSSEQWAQLLADGRTGAAASALDIGAGDGSLSLPMRSLVGRLVGTELTMPLVGRLSAVGFEAVLTEEPTPASLGAEPHSFDWVLILNVLDRCKDPFSLLRQAKHMLARGGRLVVSVVLPASQSDAAARVGATQTRWAVAGDTFEAAASSLLRQLLIPAGLIPERVVRAPYLCAGDRYSPVAALDACIVVLSPLEDADGADEPPCVECDETDRLL